MLNINIMSSDQLVREFALLTTCDYKVKELESSLSLYGINVIKLDPNLDFAKYLKSSTSRHKIMGVLREQTYLYHHNTKEMANLSHLELVDHYSCMTLYGLNSDKKYEETTFGFIDLNRKVNDSKYDWDDIFVVRSCNMSYYELSKLKRKISSRDKNISKIIEDHIHYKKNVDLHHNPQNYKQCIDFSQSVYDYVKNIKEFDSEYMKKLKLDNILTIAINQGVFFRSATTRREKIYWCPGLNAGIPLTPKPKDPIHELTYQMHDFSHFNIPDLVFDGVASPLHKKVYITYRLISEAVTLVLADMIFVNSILKSGYDYKTVNQRNIYPIFQEIEKNNKINEPFIKKLLKGSFEHCFYGKSEIWASMMENKEVLRQFANKYDPYFMEDFKWTLNNYYDMVKNKEVFLSWWKSIESWRKFGHNLELQSVSEFIEENQLNSALENDILYENIFDAVYNKYIKRIFNGEIELYKKEKQLQNSFVRYMMGQSIIFFQYENFSQSMIYFKYIESGMCNINNICDQNIINNIREFYNNYLDTLEDANLITHDDNINFRQVCPIFNPNFVDYDHFNKSTPMDKFVEEILNK